jgi:tetratricopeptide (TPR) repeat protein
MNGRTEDAGREYKLYRDLDQSQRLAEDYGSACIDALRAEPIDQARPICQRIADSGDSKRLTLLGQLYTQARAFADAVPPLQRAVELEPGSFDAWNYLGTSLFSLRRYEEALTPLRKAVALNPQLFDTLNLLAATLHDLGDDASALPILERAHSLNPADAGVTGALEKMRTAVKGKQ